MFSQLYISFMFALTFEVKRSFFCRQYFFYHLFFASIFIFGRNTIARGSRLLTWLRLSVCVWVGGLQAHVYWCEYWIIYLISFTPTSPPPTIAKTTSKKVISLASDLRVLSCRSITSSEISTKTMTLTSDDCSCLIGKSQICMYYSSSLCLAFKSRFFVVSVLIFLFSLSQLFFAGFISKRRESLR